MHGNLGKNQQRPRVIRKSRSSSWRSLVLIASSISCAHFALSAYDRPVSWSDISAIDVRPVLKTSYASPGNLYEAQFPPSAFDIALTDADQRISRGFSIEPGMRDTVAFWLRVYAEFSSRQIVIYDERHPEIVYEVVDLREIERKARNRMVYEIMAEAKVKKTLREYRAAFAQLSRKVKPTVLSETHKKILSAIQKTKHRHPMPLYASNLRSQTGQRDSIIKGLLAAETFFPQMERIFADYGVPPEITRLSLVESSFNLRAISRVGATGVWQFMPDSAREYMTINPYAQIDERLSPLKSSAAAAKLLKRGHRMLNHWSLAITSYHNGYRGLTKIAQQAKRGQDPFSFLSLCGGQRSSIGWASRNYYASFLAVLHAESYRDLFYGDAPKPQVRAVTFQRLLRSRTGLQLTKDFSIPLQEFRFYNPDIRNMSTTLPRGFWIALPGGSQDDLTGILAKRDSRKGKSRADSG